VRKQQNTNETGKEWLMNATEILHRIDAGNREEEEKLTAMLVPIDPRLTVDIFNRGDFEYEVAVGRDGRNTHTQGERFRFGVNRLNLCPFVGNEEFCFGFEDAPDDALDFLRIETAKTVWNHFNGHPERVFSVVDPIGFARSERVRENRMQDVIDAGFERQERFEARVEAKVGELWAKAKGSDDLILGDIQNWVDEPSEELAGIAHEYALVRPRDFRSFLESDFAAFGKRVAKRLERIMDHIAVSIHAREGD
jgi:hypothetical protein